MAIVTTQITACLLQILRYLSAVNAGLLLLCETLSRPAGLRQRRVAEFAGGNSIAVYRADVHFDLPPDAFERPEREIILAGRHRQPQPAPENRTAAGVDELPGPEREATAFVFDGNSRKAIPGSFRRADQRVQIDRHSRFLQQLIQRQHQRGRRKNADETFAFGGIAFNAPARRNFTGAVFQTPAQHLFGKAETDLMPVAVAKRQKDVDETSCRQPADQRRLFNENGFHPHPGRLNCRRDPCDSATYDGDVIHLHHDVTYPF